jgi:hypothetical protein
MNKDELRKQRIFQQLGMSHGAAANKLRKNILFHLLVCLQQNVCFKCKQVISVAEDLSVEHKEPWEGRDSSLFWDLDNIAFSHCDCNRPHSYYRSPYNVPDGMRWCSRHKRALPVSEFYDSRSGTYCKVCKRDVDTRKNHAKIENSES